jgi:prepilin-type processing-associated H-X9-DG protein
LVSEVRPPATTSTTDQYWLLYPYIKSRQLFQCPSFEGFSSTRPYGYAYNLIAGYPDYYTDAGPVLSESIVEEPSLMIAFIDSSWARDAYPVATKTGTLNGNWRVSYCKVAGDACPSTERFGRHLDGINASYMDGHVKWHKIDYFYNGGKNYPVWQGWQ